ncbi:MAG: phosphohydrolase [Patescibacteria group bacterium]
MTRAEAYEALHTYITNPNLIKHHLACEAIMTSLCKRFYTNADEVLLNKWGIVGLLHDADYELTRGNPADHTIVLQEKIGASLDQDVMHAIKAHNYLNTGAVPSSLMDWSMYCCDELSGLIITSALSHPDKNLASLDAGFIMNRFNDSSFAKGVNHEQIKMCEEKLKIPLKDFIQISLTAMQGIASELNL